MKKIVRCEDWNDDPLPKVGPVVWTLDANTDGKALYSDREKIVIGTRDGRVIFVDHGGEFIKQYQLNNPVSAVFQDGGILYAWSHSRLPLPGLKGSLYDISNELPAKLLDVHDFGHVVSHAAMRAGCLALADDKGAVAWLGGDGRVLWAHEDSKLGHGGLLSADDSGVYVAHRHKVVKYAAADGAVLWQFSLPSRGRASSIQAATITAEHVFVEAGGQVLQVDNTHGSLVRAFRPHRHRATGAVTGNGLLVTGEAPTVIFDIESGKEIFRMTLSSRMKDAAALIDEFGQMLKFWDKLYKIDLSPRSIHRALGGSSTRTFERAVPEIAESAGRELCLSTVEAAARAQDGSLVACQQDGDLVVVHPVSDVHRVDWLVALPLHLREDGLKYFVEKLIPSEKGSYYRCKGFIKRVIPTSTECIGKDSESESYE